MGRSIFIGDVHGCARELALLLERVGPGEGDSVYFVGDLIARGPDSAGVIRLFRETNARGVVGNHELRLLDVRRALAAGEPGVRVGKRQEALLRELGDEDFATLESLPLSLDVPEHSIRVVHAGVLPGKAFAEQDPWTLAHIRSVTKAGLASAEFGASSWAAAYDEEPHIVFGHDARRGLQMHAHATGLDTACVYGGELTALVVPAGATLPIPPDRRALLVSVRALAVYYDTSGSMMA
jgi:diadenosine tetraphosphatase ApaH/serine/threonine PP2A family protein phosphatase